MISADSVYNKLFIAETILPDDFALYTHASMKARDISAYYLALSLLKKNIDTIAVFKSYFNSIFNSNFNAFKIINSNYFNSAILNRQTATVDSKLNDIANVILQNKSASNGLLAGKAGEMLFLLKYQQYRNLSQYNDFINNTIAAIIADISKEDTKNFNLATGLAGKGFALICLQYSNFPNYDFASALTTVDKKLFAFVNVMIKSNNLGLLNGLTGIGVYFLYRKMKFHIKFIISELSNKQEELLRLPVDMATGLLGILSFLVETENVIPENPET